MYVITVVCVRETSICTLPLMYSYIAVCRFCAVRRVIIICLSLLFSNYSTYVFQYSLYVCFCVVFAVLYCSVYCFPFVLSVSYFLQVYLPFPQGGNPIAVYNDNNNNNNNNKLQAVPPSNKQKTLKFSFTSVQYLEHEVSSPYTAQGHTGYCGMVRGPNVDKSK